ncbi:MAG TPA: hypothetical protein PLI09_16285 [Candidatus Hydrogenedentes bacterium]|nr:hypothetical protein [Candidatus Hydrogenedentota bacterium]
MSIFAAVLVLAGMTGADKALPAFELDEDLPGTVQFLGSDTARVYGKEIKKSFKGVLKKNYVKKDKDGFPAGFLHASPPPQVWSGTFWTRDGGTFLRELTLWGLTAHACQTCACLIKLVEKNDAGYFTFPEYFAPGKPGLGNELDGTASIIIGMVLLWERLPIDAPFREQIHAFLHQDASPVRYVLKQLETAPLIAGTGEFGGGCGIPGEHCNTVQNYLILLALEAMARMESRAGFQDDADACKQCATRLMENIERYLVQKNGAWWWCVDPKTFQSDPGIVNHVINKGFGGLNGPGSMYSDALGLEPLAEKHYGVEHSVKTFETLFAVPQRKEQFDKYGIWIQFDEFRAGLSSGPSYGDGYALQAMLLFDKMSMADKALAWMASSTRHPVPEYRIPRKSPFHFYERSYSPEAVGKLDLDVGCGALNLVNVTEQLKVARLIVGVDDLDPACVKLLPRIPPSWSGLHASHWPILTPSGLLRADIRVKRTEEGKIQVEIKIIGDKVIPRLDIRFPTQNGCEWQTFREVSTLFVQK